MELRDLKLAIYSHLDVLAVTFNGARLDWQFEPHTPHATWLTVLGIDYSTSDFGADLAPLNLTVTVRGKTSELCPASSFFGSQGSCEYVMSGYNTAPSRDLCCPKGVTAYFTPSWLRQAAGLPLA